MTAEVAILNKLGVALAADSTVSIGDKTYDSANKLFTLSKHHPVGILVYNSMEMTTVPLEIMIKTYREAIKNKSYKALKAYASGFVEYIRKRAPVGKEEEKENVAALIDDICAKIRNDLRIRCGEENIQLEGALDSPEVQKALIEILDTIKARAKTAGNFSGFTPTDEARFAREYQQLLEMRVRRHFKRYGLTAAKMRSVQALFPMAFGSKLLSGNHTGFVIAGYGDAEHYPSIIPYRTDGFLAGKLKIVDGEDMAITFDRRAVIYPFAQDDVAKLFIEGVDDTYQKFLEKSIRTIIPSIANTAANIKTRRFATCRVSVYSSMKFGRLYMQSRKTSRSQKMRPKVAAMLGHGLRLMRTPSLSRHGTLVIAVLRRPWILLPI